jgi:hypothetical protein
MSQANNKAFYSNYPPFKWSPWKINKRTFCFISFSFLFHSLSLYPLCFKIMGNFSNREFDTFVTCTFAVLSVLGAFGRWFLLGWAINSVPEEVSFLRREDFTIKIRCPLILVCLDRCSDICVWSTFLSFFGCFVRFELSSLLLLYDHLATSNFGDFVDWTPR